MALSVWGGATWWNAEAASYSLDVYRPLKVDPVLSGNVLDLKVEALSIRTANGEAARTTTFCPTTVT